MVTMTFESWQRHKKNNYKSKKQSEPTTTKEKNRSGKEASTHHNLKVITQTHEFKYFKLTILVAKLLESTGKVKNCVWYHIFNVFFGS